MVVVVVVVVVAVVAVVVVVVVVVRSQTHTHTHKRSISFLLLSLFFFVNFNVVFLVPNSFAFGWNLETSSNGKLKATNDRNSVKLGKSRVGTTETQ